MSLCILCRELLTCQEPKEHVLLNALGGKLKVQGLCRPCNTERLGGGPDRELAESARWLDGSVVGWQGLLKGLQRELQERFSLRQSALGLHYEA